MDCDKKMNSVIRSALEEGEISDDDLEVSQEELDAVDPARIQRIKDAVMKNIREKENELL